MARLDSYVVTFFIQGNEYCFGTLQLGRSGRLFQMYLDIYYIFLDQSRRAIRSQYPRIWI